GKPTVNTCAERPRLTRLSKASAIPRAFGTAESVIHTLSAAGVRSAPSNVYAQNCVDLARRLHRVDCRRRGQPQCALPRTCGARDRAGHALRHRMAVLPQPAALIRYASPRTRAIVSPISAGDFTT